ncbi:hypothetical protein [Caballeronia arationis]|jgi:hypothetical protein|nr:hypothetical protein [Caballeronia arationis]
MLIVRELNGLQRASGVLGHFSGPAEARQFALAYGMAEIDDRPPGAPAALLQPSGRKDAALRHAA